METPQSDAVESFWTAYELVPEAEKAHLVRHLFNENQDLAFRVFYSAGFSDHDGIRKLLKGKINYLRRWNRSLRNNEGGTFAKMVFFDLLFLGENPFAGPYVEKWMESASRRGRELSLKAIIRESANDPVAVFVARYINAFISTGEDWLEDLCHKSCQTPFWLGLWNEKVTALPPPTLGEISEPGHLESDEALAPGEPHFQETSSDAPAQTALTSPVRAHVEVRRDQPAAGVRHRDIKHPIVIHGDVFNLMDDPTFGNRLNLVLTHLAAHGRTSIVKGCKDAENRGWLRTPISGNHYYLWWAHWHSARVQDLHLATGSVVVRAVRHHDDHGSLNAGKPDDFAHLEAHDLVDCRFQPWTDTQKKFIFDETPVRILAGNPGSGKTTALWKAVAARAGQRVLYLTWSRDLARVAREHFDSFAGSDVEVVARDLSSFWGEILQRDIPRADLGRSLRCFENHAAYLDSSQIGKWRGRIQALHAEARAVVYGMADPLAGESGLALLDCQAYNATRRESLGPASERVVRAVSAIGDKLSAGGWIPELEAAALAAKWIRDHELPDGWDRFDRIVIDEVQDLTKLELTAVMVFYRAVALRQQRLPWLLVAGDEGQTVVPTQFKWGWLKTTIHGFLQKLADSPQTLFLDSRLDSNLRCPSNICDVLDRATRLYARLPKIDKPGDQSPPSEGQVHDARLMHVVCQTTEEAVEVVGNLTTREDFVVINLEDEPAWIAPCEKMEAGCMASLMDRMLTPAMAKGLEFQSVCIVNAGRTLLKIKRLTEDSERLSEMAARCLIDQFRVALSRTTEDLIFLDVRPTSQEAKESLDLLQKPLVVNAQGLAGYYKDFDASPEDRVRARLKLARNFVDNDIRRAWRLANEAMRMLGDAKMTGGVADPELRREVNLEILTLAAGLLLDYPEEKDLVSHAMSAANESLEELASDSDRRMFATLCAWAGFTLGPDLSARGGIGTAIDFLDALVEAGGDKSWIESVLPACAQRLRTDIERAAGDDRYAGRLIGPVSEWLGLTCEVGDLRERVVALRRTAFDTLVSAGNLSEARAILDLMPEESGALRGRMHEAEHLFELAAKAFEIAGMTDDAFRNWRQAGIWEGARNLADGSDDEHLAWLCKITELLDGRPVGLVEWMTKGERERFDGLLSQCATNVGDDSRMPTKTAE